MSKQAMSNIVGVTTLTGVISKLVTALSQIGSIYLINLYGGVESYALFGVLTGMIGWYLLADFGIGNAIQNKISALSARNENSNDLVFQAFLFIMVLSASYVIIMFALKDFVGNLILRNFDINSSAKGDLFFSASISYVSITLASVYYKILFGESKGYLGNLIGGCGAIIGIASLYIMVNAGIPGLSLTLLLAVYLLPNYILPLIFFANRILRTTSALDSFRALKEINFTVALKFFALSFFAAAVVQVDVFFIAVLLNPQEIAEYLILGKFFTLIYFLYSAFLQSLWPHLATLNASANFGKIKQIIFKTVNWAFIIGFSLMLIIFVFRDYMVDILSSGQIISLPNNLVIAFMCLTFIRLWTDVYATFLQAVSELDTFLLSIMLQASINIPLMYILGDLYGAIGIVSAITFSYLLTVGWILPFVSYRILNH